ncbi:uncharacterized protein LOC111071905 [Drosophila obscura]|uniref:uncharacterized protein LOC111071905 n=1 Tax=Drosophila obscura TaxID=7282 RepID=UPI000BA02A8F|nr:uncharacterized protein LOC111071905 [Drosophila obscura]
MTSRNTTGKLLVDLVQCIDEPIGYEYIMQMMADATAQKLSTPARRTVRETLDAAVKLGFLQRNQRGKFKGSPLAPETTLTILTAEDMADNCCDIDKSVDHTSAAFSVEGVTGRKKNRRGALKLMDCDSLMTAASTSRRERSARRGKSAKARNKKSGGHSMAKGRRSGGAFFKYCVKPKPGHKICLHCQRKKALQN